jgi:hypothetical protein
LARRYDTEGDDMEPLIRAIKTLTIAVWCLCALVLAQLVLYGVSSIRSARWMRTATASRTESPAISPARRESLRSTEADDPPLHDLPPDEVVARSSAILLTSYQKDGDRFKAIVAEVLKQAPDTKLYYAVGDEFPTLSFYPKEGETCGEGQVVFMVGSPASMRLSYSFDNGRIGGLGDMPLSTLREMVKGKKS